MAIPKIKTKRIFTYLAINCKAKSGAPDFPFKYQGISDEKTLENNGDFSIQMPSDIVSFNTEEGINANYMTTYKINLNYLESAKLDLTTQFDGDDSVAYFLLQIEKILKKGFPAFQVAPTLTSFIRNIGSDEAEKQRLFYIISMTMQSADNYNEKTP